MNARLAWIAAPAAGLTLVLAACGGPAGEPQVPPGPVGTTAGPASSATAPGAAASPAGATRPASTAPLGTAASAPDAAAVVVLALTGADGAGMSRCLASANRLLPAYSGGSMLGAARALGEVDASRGEVELRLEAGTHRVSITCDDGWSGALDQVVALEGRTIPYVFELVQQD
ncbi:hypothetical protein ACQ3I4_01130 [Zafaria sp. Z1313]|uniref:hypothetical protein n=1 Tax=unclassified Zafaria TaxID=2828765 RepID=UPI002E763899|nr:hypothetical protein [Zafaria sp. J156]MEE1619984.1 hypothetical protein [Zafaria sp. J156]